MKPILYSVNNISEHDPFTIYKDVIPTYHPDQLKEGGMVLLHGGEDISPSIYNQEPNNFCHAPRTPSNRDAREMAIVDRAYKMGLPIIGICRGAQLLCAMDGGILIQHIYNHTGGTHAIVDTETAEIVKSNSCHHQMMVPSDNAKILAITDEKVRGIDENDREVTFDHCPEVVYFKKLKAIGIQGHPEWLQGSPFVQYCRDIIKRYLLGE